MRSPEHLDHVRVVQLVPNVDLLLDPRLLPNAHHFAIDEESFNHHFRAGSPNFVKNRSKGPTGERVGLHFDLADREKPRRLNNVRSRFCFVVPAITVVIMDSMTLRSVFLAAARSRTAALAGLRCAHGSCRSRRTIALSRTMATMIIFATLRSSSNCSLQSCMLVT